MSGPNQNPIFLLTPICATALATVANTGRDGSGTLVSVVTGATNGTRIDRVHLQAITTTAAGVLRLYVDDLTNKRLIAEVSTPAVTPSGTVLAAFAELTRSDGLPFLVLPSGYILKAAQHNGSESWVITALGGNY